MPVQARIDSEQPEDVGGELPPRHPGLSEQPDPVLGLEVGDD